VVAPVGSKKKSRAANGVQVAWYIAILAFALIGEATVYARIVDLLGDGLSIRYPGPRMDQEPAVPSKPSPGSMKLSRVTKSRAMRWKLGVAQFAEESQRRIAVGMIAQIAPKSGRMCGFPFTT